MKNILAVAACTAAIAWSSAASAGIIDVISNGDFENGITGWSVTNPSGHATGVQAIDIDGGGALGSSNAFYAQTGGGYGTLPVDIFQSVTLISGVQYDFSADIASYNAGSRNSSGGVIQATVGGSTLGIFNFGPISSGAWEYSSLSGTFVASSSGIFNINLFRPFISSLHTPTNYIDNVSLTYDDGSSLPSPVPEPGTLLLFGTGIIGLLAGTRSKRKK